MSWFHIAPRCLRSSMRLDDFPRSRLEHMDALSAGREWLAGPLNMGFRSPSGRRPHRDVDGSLLATRVTVPFAATR